MILPVILVNCSDNKGKKGSVVDSDGSVIPLTEAAFKELIFNYDKNHQWKYEGSVPAIIDFYADWCAPCRQLSPLVEEIAKEYKGRIIVYKVDTDQERVLTGNMGIASLPTLLFIPKEGMPVASMGLIPKDTIVKTVDKVLLSK